MEAQDERTTGSVDDLAALLGDMEPAEAAAYEDANARAELLRGLVESRKRHGVSQKVVAEAMDTTQSAVSELENTGIDPRLSTLQRYARALGKKLHFVVGQPANAIASADIGSDVLPGTFEWGIGLVLKDLLRAQAEHGSRSADQIVRHTGLSEALVGRAVARLSDNEWIHAVGNTPERLPIVTLNADRALVVGVSIRADRIQGVITNLRAETPVVIQSAELPSGEPAAVVGAVADLVGSLTSAVGDRSEIIGLGVELAGLIDRDLGIVRYAPDLEPRSTGWRNFPLQAEVQVATGLRTVVENDTNALAVHEYLRHGDVEELAVVLLSEQGIGGGLIFDGKVLRGRGGITGEIGHIEVAPKGYPCRHLRQHGCLETVASPASITREAKTRDLGEAAENVRNGDEQATRAFRAAGTALGRVLTTLTSITAPSLIVIYGRPELTHKERFSSARTFSNAVRDRLDAGWFTQFNHKVDIITRELEDTAGARGAASVAVSHFLDRPLRWLSDPEAPAGQRFDESLLAKAP
jgi:predicted NBD/HSP70 family sugar kinase/transcriptional regulator with XRE-family HTH domain